MAITHATPPAPSVEVLTDQVIPLHLPSDEFLRMPHPVFDVDPADLRAGRGLDAATLSGWRYVARSEAGELSVVEIGVDDSDGEHSLRFINAGDHVDNLVALHDDTPTAVLDKDYELSFLRSPECYIVAMWFTAVDDGHQFLVPLAPAHSNVVPNIAYEADEFTTLLQRTAHQMTGSADAAEAAGPDDLTVIEGVGPQIAGLLREKGLTSFALVAQRSVAELESILREAGARFNRSDPTTWPEQAALAVERRWTDLDALQRRLTGGR